MISLKNAVVMWVITFNPSDFPGKFVARRRNVVEVAGGSTQQFIAVVPTAIVETLDEARNAIFDEASAGHKITSLMLSPRHKDDDLVIVESWF